MQFDMEIAREISERITEQHESGKRKNGGSRSAREAVANRNRKREMVSGKEVENEMSKWLSGE